MMSTNNFNKLPSNHAEITAVLSFFCQTDKNDNCKRIHRALTSFGTELAYIISE